MINRIKEENIKTVTRDGLRFSYQHEKEFESIYQSIFVKNEYAFVTEKQTPRIIDCGSHIGLATLYFKKKYPKAVIICFEPNPLTFGLLQRNIRQNNLNSVTLVNAAVAATKGKVSFYIENPKEGEIPYTWGDSVAKNKWVEEHAGAYKLISVQADRLSDYLDKPVDLLKLDIEGSEEVVLNEAGNNLKNIKELIMEFHGSSTNPTNDSGRILALLKKSGFSYKITQKGKPIEEHEIQKENPYWLIVRAYRGKND